MKSEHRLVILFFVVIAILLTSCSSMMTMKDQFKGINEKTAQRDYAGALALIEKAKDKYYQAKDRVMYYLDAGMLSHYAGRYEQSNDYLSQAEAAIEELYTASVSKAAASLLLNDNALDYSGEDYEDIYLNVFKALNYLHLDLRDDALVEIKRISNKLNLLEDRYAKLADEYNKDKNNKLKMRTGTNKFYNSALARYLSMLIYRGESAMDAARIDRDKIREAFARQANLYPFPPPRLDDALSRTTRARLNVICFTGKNPDKVAATLRLHSFNNALVVVPSAENDQFQDEIKDFAAFPWPGIPSDYYFKFQLPIMKPLGSRVAAVNVRLTGTENAETTGQPIESLEKIAKFTFEVKKPLVYLKTVLRSVTKGILAGQAKKGVKKDATPLGSFLFNVATDVATDVSENADLRISHFFPAEALIAETEVPTGMYRVEIDYLDQDGNLMFTDDKGEVDVSAKGLTLVESFLLE
jgi:hypothetical protein